MKNAQTKQVLSHAKSATLNQDRDNNMKLANMEKKHTFSEIISEFRQFLKSVLFNELLLDKAFKMIEHLKEKYQKDIFSIYEANLKINSFDSKKNQNLQNNIKLPLNHADKSKMESVQFLPLESALMEKEGNYKITLNGCLLKEEAKKKLTVQTKKTIDTQKSSDDCEDDRQIMKWKSLDQKNFPKNDIKISCSQKNFEACRKQNQKVVRGIDYLYK